MKVVQGLLVSLGAVAAALVFTAGPASAGGDDDKANINTGPNVGIANGIVLNDLIDIKKNNICGNTVGVLGLALNGGTSICKVH